MRNVFTIAFGAGPAAALITALAAGAGAGPAAAAETGGPEGAELHLGYDRPGEAPDGSGVIWHWTLRNDGARAAGEIVVSQRITPGRRVIEVSRPCAAEKGAIVCRYDSLRPGEKRAGWFRTPEPPGGAGLRVTARLTWRESRSMSLTTAMAPGAWRHHPVY